MYLQITLYSMKRVKHTQEGVQNIIAMLVKSVSVAKETHSKRPS
jgi:hypothetical protein